MSLKTRIERMAKRLTQIQLLCRVEPHGVDYIRDIANFFPTQRTSIVFDVGANVGQSSKIYLARFPNSHIYCFEPVSNTFHQLQANLKGNKRIDFYQLAFGASKGKGKMVLKGSSDMFFLSGQSKKLTADNDTATELVDIITLDEFCQTEKISQINYLKIDTEGGGS